MRLRYNLLLPLHPLRRSCTAGRGVIETLLLLTYMILELDGPSTAE